MESIAEAIERFFVARGVMKSGLPREQWYTDKWVRVPVKGYRIPILPIHGFKKSFILHDMHHVLTDYDIDFKGELEIAAWELGSGGCGHFYLYWLDRFVFMGLGLLFYPRATWTAFCRGRQHKNLFRHKAEDLMDRPLCEVKAELGIK